MFLSLLFATAAWPQGGQTGAIAGSVKDPSGAVVPGATIKVFNETTGRLERTVSTAADGNYAVTLLTPGSYRVQITAQGFKEYNAVQVPVRLNEATRLDGTLEVGAVQESITVEATPTLVSTLSATMGQPIDTNTLGQLPLPVPNFLFLLTLSTGTAGEPPDVRNANRGIVDINVNGGRTTNNSVSLEGINVNDFNLAHFDTIPLPNPSTIQEFKVATSLYDASLGSKGGGSLNLVLKTGSKDFHGEAYWFHRNDTLNANEWFFNRNGTPKGRLLNNTLGVSAGGPVWKLGGFWFANVHGLRARNGIDPSGSVARPIIPVFNRNTDGTASAALLAQQFGLNAADIDPIAVNILNLKNSNYGGEFFVPRPGQAGCGAITAGNPATFRCTFSKIAQLEDTQYTITYDRPMRDGRDRLAVRWFYDNGKTVKPFGSGGSLPFPRDDVQRNRFLSINHQHIISPRQVNEFRAGYSRFNSSFAPTDLIKLSDIGATRPNAGEIPGVYSLGISGLFSFGVGVNDERGTVSNTFYYADTWSMTRGKHTFRAGAEISRYQLNRFNRFAVRGDITTASITGPPAFTAFQAFLTGRVTNLQSGGGDPQRYFRALDAAGFFQDDLRITPRLTVNLGLRWEGMGFSREKLNRLGNYDPALLLKDPNSNPFLFAESTNLGGFTGTKGIPDCVLASCLDKNNWAPRVSFAWDVRGTQRTVVRGGYGIYYQRLSNQNILQANLSPPFNVQLIQSRGSGEPAKSLKDPFVGQPSVGLIATTLIPQASRFAGVTGDINSAAGTAIFINADGQRCANFGGTAANCSINLASFTAPPMNTYSPYTQQWNLTIQQQLWKGWAVEMGYIGSHYVGGVGIWNPYLARLASPSNPITVKDINGNTYTITTNTENNEALRHEVLGLSRRAGARFSGNIGQGIYHSAQLTVSRRFRGGLFFQGAYTFSKIIDNVSGSQSTDELNATRAGQLGANLIGLGNKYPQLNRARGDFDRPHRFIVSYTWELPVPKRGLWGSQLFQGWSISGIVIYQNGLPFSITDPAGGRIYGGGTSTPLMACAPLAQQITTLPTCTPGQPINLAQAILPGKLQDRIDNYLNPNFFSAAPRDPNGTATLYGDVPRNTFRAPFQQNWDFSVGKKFKITERHNVQFRAEFFNLWNHPVFQTPAVVSISTRNTFGQITNTAIPARLIQFGLKYQF